MSMYYKLREKLSAEIDKMAERPGFTRNDLDDAYKLSVAAEKLMKMEKMEEEGNSYGGMWSPEGSYDGSYEGSHRGSYDNYAGDKSMRRSRANSMRSEVGYSEEDRRSLARARELMDY